MKNYNVTYANANAASAEDKRIIILSEAELMEAKRNTCSHCPFKFSCCDNYCRNGIIGSEEGTPTDLEPVIAAIEAVEET